MYFQCLAQKIQTTKSAVIISTEGHFLNKIIWEDNRKYWLKYVLYVFVKKEKKYACWTQQQVYIMLVSTVILILLKLSENTTKINQIKLNISDC